MGFGLSGKRESLNPPHFDPADPDPRPDDDSYRTPSWYTPVLAGLAGGDRGDGCLSAIGGGVDGGITRSL